MQRDVPVWVLVVVAVGIALVSTSTGAYFVRRNELVPACPVIARELAECRRVLRTEQRHTDDCEARSRELLAAAVNCGGGR